MVKKQISDYCLSKPGAYEDFTFGEIPICYKVCGKLFLQLYPMPDNNKITISCEPICSGSFLALMKQRNTSASQDDAEMN